MQAAAREAFDLIFMDEQVPERGGFEATCRIREAELATAHAMAGDREFCLSAGMDDYLFKRSNKVALFALLIASPRHGPTPRRACLARCRVAGGR